ncbi:hypothetical protein ACFSQJ_17985 [Croceitalea marina]|uniref:Uncharacterized protein n=1 Tax=Croceitalea marina TaxID=1775166 RepID=A0ABW5N178_9FLAO
MKQLQLIAFALLILPLGVLGQTKRLMSTEAFYASLAEKDAKYELSYTFLSAEDERDFWKDQESFENALADKNILAYQFYLKHKIKFYKDHQAACSLKCGHSTLFLKHATTYINRYTSGDYLEGLSFVKDK